METGPSNAMRSARRESTLAEGGSSWGGLLLGLGFAALVLSGDHSNGVFDESTQGLAIAALMCLPGTLCMIARRSRPSLFLAGGIIGVTIPMLLGSIIGIGFWLPAGLALVAYGRRAGSVRTWLAEPIIAVACFALALGALVALFVHQDPACSGTPNSSYCTSDYVTRTEGLVSVAITGITVVAGWALSRPRRDA